LPDPLFERSLRATAARIKYWEIYGFAERWCRLLPNRQPHSNWRMRPLRRTAIMAR